MIDPSELAGLRAALKLCLPGTASAFNVRARIRQIEAQAEQRTAALPQDGSGPISGLANTSDNRLPPAAAPDRCAYCGCDKWVPGNPPAPLAAPGGGEAVAYQCFAWGESDLPAAVIAATRVEVLQFLVDEWFGEKPEKMGDENRAKFDEAVAEFDSHQWDDDGPLKWTFEIGGVEITRVNCLLAPPTPAGAKPQHVHAQDAQNWGHCVHCGEPIAASEPSDWVAVPRDTLTSIYHDLAAICPNPGDECPDFDTCLGRENSADAECLTRAYLALRAMLAVAPQDAAVAQQPSTACNRCGSFSAADCNTRGCFFLESGNGEPPVAQPNEPAQALPQAVLDFDAFLNEPPQYEDRLMVREYRHEAYPKWESALKALRAAQPAKVSEYICKCGIRVSPHRCSTSEDF